MATIKTLFNINDTFIFKKPILESDSGEEVYKVKTIEITLEHIKYTCERFIPMKKQTEDRVFLESWIDSENIIRLHREDYEEIVNDYLSIFAV